jgi:hypothetical protein
MDIKPMTTNSIAKILREDPFSKTFFIGAFPRDQFPIIKSYPASFVIRILF